MGYCGIEKAIILIYAFYSTVFYATSKSTSHFRRIMRHSLDVAFPSNKIGRIKCDELNATELRRLN